MKKILIVILTISIYIYVCIHSKSISMYSLGIDIGSSSVKVSLLNIDTGKSIGSAFYPENELEINAPQPGWAEQDPDVWWNSFLKAYQKVLSTSGVRSDDVRSIGISYQMHGLVILDEELKVLRPSIIWCDSRAVTIGQEAFDRLGAAYCNTSLLNSPGNFTASKLRWVKENEPEIFDRVRYFMLPGDFIALKLSGRVTTTNSGLSEGVFWDFDKREVSGKLLEHYGIAHSMLPEVTPTFGRQAEVSSEVSRLTGIQAGTPVSYRAGDQPNNAFSLNVLHPGEVAATAGTSGVIYAITDQNVGDKDSRVNTFLHVNDEPTIARNGVLLCVNGTGILNSWMKKFVGGNSFSYEQLNDLAAEVSVGADGLRFFPFGNGAERVLKNKYPKATLANLDFNRHNQKHVFRAGQEGIVFALRYGFDVLNELGVAGRTIRAGKANMFLSPIFREAFVNTVGARVELYKTDGAEGAARGAAYGAGIYSSRDEAFAGLEVIESIDPDTGLSKRYEDAYQEWKEELIHQLEYK